MSTAATASPPLTSERGRWYVAVPWDCAHQWHARLGREGLQSTLCLDPAAREARLELWQGVDPQRALAVLQEMRPPDPGQKAA